MKVGWLQWKTRSCRRHRTVTPHWPGWDSGLTTRHAPPQQAVSALSVETKTYYSEWATLARRDGLLYRVWRAPGWRRDVWQLLVPKDWHQRVLHAVHGSVGAGHYGVAKTLNKLRQHFYWPGCRKDTELFVHCCDSCTAKKGPTGRSHAPLQQYQVGAPQNPLAAVFLKALCIIGI